MFHNCKALNQPMIMNVSNMHSMFKVEANIGAPQVAYRETITQQADFNYTHKKQSGGSGQYGRVADAVKIIDPRHE